MFIKSISKTLSIGVAGMLALTASVFAQSGTGITNSSTTETNMRYYVDFASTTIAGHASQPTGTFAGSVVKFHSLQLLSNASTGACFEIMTVHPDFIPNEVADTRIWYVNNAGVNAVLNDDFGGTLFSRANVYLLGFQSFKNLSIAAFSPSWNNAQFTINVNRSNKSESSCTTGNGGVPWLKVINGVLTNG